MRTIRLLSQTDILLAELIVATRNAHGMLSAEIKGGDLVIEEEEVRKVVEVVETPEPPRPVIEVVEEKPKEVVKPVVESKPLHKKAGRPKGR